MYINRLAIGHLFQTFLYRIKEIVVNNRKISKCLQNNAVMQITISYKQC